MSQPDPSSDPVTPDPSAQPASPRRPRFRLTNWQIILILLVVVGGRLVIDFSQRIIEGQQKLAEQRALEAQIEALRNEHDALDAARIYYNSQAYVEAWAHDQGKMVRDGEMLVIPLYQREAQDTAPDLPVAAGTLTAANASQPAWQVWWSLFFDEQPPSIDAGNPANG